MNAGDPEGLAVPVPYIPPVVLLLDDTNERLWWFYVTYWQCGFLSLTDCVVFCHLLIVVLCHLLTVWYSVTYWLCGFLSLTDCVVFCHLLTVWFSVTYWQCGFSFYCWRWAILFYLFLLFQQYYMYIICWLNRTLSKPKTCLNQTHFTVPSTKCLCNLNLPKSNTCLNWTNSSVLKGFGLDRFYCVSWSLTWHWRHNCSGDCIVTCEFNYHTIASTTDL